MFDKKDVIEFFDRYAPGWDETLVTNEEILGIILDRACVSEGKTVLDVGCGTGVMISRYLTRGVERVVGIDISPKMAEIAAGKFPRENVTILCDDVETAELPGPFDCIVVYNAFPHFLDPKRLIRILSEKLASGGTLTVAHGASRETIDAHHHGSAMRVSNGLMEADALAAIFAEHLEVTDVISDARMYLVTGRRR